MAKISLATVIAAIGAAETIVPEALPAFLALIDAVKELFDAPDQAAIEAALANLDAAADAQHKAAQSI